MEKLLTKNQEQGILLEQVLDSALTKLNISHSQNPFDNRYANVEGQGVDSEIRYSKGYIGIECKNLTPTYYCSSEWMKREVYTRFSIHKIKVILFSILMASQSVKEKLKKKDYRIIEIGFKVTSQNFEKAVNILIKKLYWIKKNFNIKKYYKPTISSSSQIKFPSNSPSLKNISNNDKHMSSFREKLDITNSNISIYINNNYYNKLNNNKANKMTKIHDTLTNKTRKNIKLNYKWFIILSKILSKTNSLT